MIRWLAAIVSVLIITLFSGLVFSGTARNTDERNDAIFIDSSKHFSKDERPPVYFFHDFHTDALAYKNKNCGTCHIQEEGRLTFRFIPEDKESWESSMNGYHDRCIGCHTREMAAREPAGPVVCSGCHREDAVIINNGRSGRLDKSLHQRHALTMNRSCESCHHVYDPVLKKTVYKKGEEGSCVYCHPETDNGKDMTLRTASHNQCVTCHTSKLDAGKKAGPIRCEGCHDPEIRDSFKKVDDIERLVMGQKDTMMLDPYGIATTETMKNRMNYVPFDHKNHEKVSDSCSACHHKALKSCTECHTLEAHEKGGYVSLETAMHAKDQSRTCTGCHEIRKKTAECAGCHGFDVNLDNDKKNCAACHLATDLSDDPVLQARSMIDEKTAAPIHVDDALIPETLVLNKLEKSYQAVTFPHRKIVKTLTANMDKDRMARFFHKDEFTVCSGCHHNAPATKSPTACSSCHPAVDTTQDTYKPGLLGAYHIQCMECHVRMNIRQPESCTQCHKEKH